MDNQCKVCNKIFDTETKLHRHLKEHGLLVQEYYVKYYPRKDPYSGQQVPFKNKKQYFETVFLSQENLKAWFAAQSLNIQKNYCLTFLKNRIEKKNLKYAPSQMELRSIIGPSIPTFLKLFGNYNALCEELGAKGRFLYDIPQFKPVEKLENVKIRIDTREQMPLLIDYETECKKLDFGDYSFNDMALCNSISLERKSLPDAISTFTTNVERFKRELGRAKEANGYLIVLIECPISSFCNYLKLGLVDRHIKIPPEAVLHNMREMIQENNNIQFLFVSSREIAAQLAPKLLFNSEICKKYDLQFLYDLKAL